MPFRRTVCPSWFYRPANIRGVFCHLAYDPLRGRLWQAAVSGEPCVEELDPSTARASGVKICPLFGSTQRGLAYDPLGQTFFSGTWNDAILGISIGAAACSIGLFGKFEYFRTGLSPGQPAPVYPVQCQPGV